MPRQKGSGAIKPIDAAKQDAFEIRRRLHAGGGEPIRNPHARLFIHWRNLIAQRDDCAKRRETGEGDKWTRKRLKQLEREIDDKWRELGVALAGLGDAELCEKLAVLSKAARPAIHAWQKEATRLIEAARLLGEKPKRLAEYEREIANRELIEQRKTEQAGMTKEQIETRKRKPYGVSKGAEQDRKQREHAAKLVPSFPTPETDKVLSLVGKSHVTAQQLHDHLRAQGHRMTIHDVRRFARDTLHVTLRSERGKRTDLKLECAGKDEER